MSTDQLHSDPCKRAGDLCQHAAKQGQRRNGFEDAMAAYLRVPHKFAQELEDVLIRLWLKDKGTRPAAVIQMLQIQGKALREERKAYIFQSAGLSLPKDILHHLFLQLSLQIKEPQ